MELIREFSGLTKDDANIAGGKGASLGEIFNAGIPVPPGFVILANTFEKFLGETGLNIEIDSILDSVDHREVHTVEHASEKIQDLILSAEVPLDIREEIERYFLKLNAVYVAVRSSATAEDSASAAWAGQLDSYLNTTRQTLLENVTKCWASLFTPRAIFYRFQKGLHKAKISVAVVVQKMVASDVSGVAFSVHPVTENANQLIIEAGFGLGEAIVSGSITPDSYVVSKDPREILDKNIATQERAIYRAEAGGDEWRNIQPEKRNAQKLSDDEILKLAEIIIGIENHYGFPCDIEWALESDFFYITQSRPITTLHAPDGQPIKDSVEEYNLQFSTSGYNILLLDRMFNNDDAYGVADYIVLCENDLATAYLSARGMDDCARVGATLDDDQFFTDLLKQSEDLCLRLQNYKSVKLDKDNVNSLWSDYFALSKAFSKIYRYYEPQFQRKIENAILRSVPQEKLLDILATKNLSSVGDPQTKRNIEKMMQMGEIKLRLHADSEAFVRDMSFVDYAAQMTGLTFDLVAAMTAREFENALSGNCSVTAEMLKKRLAGSVMLKENGLWKLYTGDKYQYWKNKLQKITNEEIKGSIAYPGAATGRAVVHLSWTDVTEIKEGEILVTGMTNPQMIPMLKNASAIVTDEGGITCHAAIIARELKKPCIVGTKNATKILRNGDLIEVDAVNGIIQIIK